MISLIKNINNILKKKIWLIITAIVTIVLIKLSLWQAEKAIISKRTTDLFSEKNNRATDIAAASFNIGEKVTGSGEIAINRNIMLDNKIHNGKIGLTWLVPCYFRAIDRWVLLDLGFIEHANRNSSINIPQINSNQKITGKIYHISTNPFNNKSHIELISSDVMKIQAININDLRQMLHIDLANFIIQVKQLPDIKIQPNYKATQMNHTKHIGYSVQWLLLAIAFLILVFKYKNKEQHESN